MINTVEKLYFKNTWGNEYKVTFSDGTLSCVPHDEANTDYQAIQKWIADGGTVIDNGGGE
tara:strand:- start:47 stop:226 length:180 start_codon:yes stop_codon:yes gene_type:complete